MTQQQKENQAYYAGRAAIWRAGKVECTFDETLTKAFYQGVKDARAEMALDADEEWG